MDNERPLVLVTNDDSIYGEGVRVLAEHMAEVGDAAQCQRTESARGGDCGRSYRSTEKTYL